MVIGSLVVLGAVGVLLRFGITQSLSSTLPFGTFIVNFIGSFLIGYIATRYSAEITSQLWVKAVVIGFLGGLTTYSGFALDTVKLFEQGKPLLAVGNISAHIFFLIPLCYLGVLLARKLP